MTPVAQSFRSMYDDFGTRESTLPRLTQIVTTQLVPLVLAIPPALVLALGLRAYAISTRRAAVTLSFLLALVTLAVFWVGFYMPIWQLADAIQS